MESELAIKHGSEFRRCLLECDVGGLIALHRAAYPHLKDIGASEALTSLHMARVDAKSMPRKVKAYSTAWLKERGYEKSGGRWDRSERLYTKVFAEAIGLSSSTLGGHKLPFNRQVERAMSDAAMNCIVKGVTEPPMQKECILKARAKLRFRKRLD